MSGVPSAPVREVLFLIIHLFEKCFKLLCRPFLPLLSVQVESVGDFEDQLAAASGGKLVVVDFHANW